MLVAGGIMLISLGATAQEDIKIGALWPIKTIAGEQARRSAQMAVDGINAAGGLLGGRKIKLIVYDDGFDPAQAVSGARRLFSDDKVKLLVGGFATAVSLAEVKVAEQNDALYLNTGSLAPDITKYRYAFRMNFSFDVYVEALHSFIAKQGTANKLALVAENGDYGRLLTNRVRADFGQQLVDAELFQLPVQADFSTIATRIKAASPDVVAMQFSATEQGAALLRAVKDAGVKAKVFILPGSLSPQLIAVAADVLGGDYSADTWVPTLDNARNREFVQLITAKYGQTPGKVDFLGYEDLVVLTAAIQKAGTADDVSKIAAVLRGNEWETPRGIVTFDGGQAMTKGGGLTEVLVQDGKIVPVH